MKRSCLKTVNQIIELIPDGESLKDDLRAFREGVFLELPEDNAHLWRQAAEIMNRYLPGGAVDGWQREVVDIWFNREAHASDEL